jgi:hypothetical protein
MNQIKLSINGQEVEALSGVSILEAARAAGIYIPALCYHPDLPPAKGGQAAEAVYQGEMPCPRNLVKAADFAWWRWRGRRTWWVHAPQRSERVWLLLRRMTVFRAKGRRT